MDTVNHNLSSTSWIEQDIKYLLRSRQADNRPNRTGKISLKSCFKYLRKQPKYTLLGDYPIISVAARHLTNLQGQLTSKDVISAFRASDELSGRFRQNSEIVQQML